MEAAIRGGRALLELIRGEQGEAQEWLDVIGSDDLTRVRKAVDDLSDMIGRML